MFEKFRQSLDDLLARATRPEDRRAVIAQMKEALVHARLGVDDLRHGVAETRARLEMERRELETIARRKSLAAGIADTETVAIAERFERQHGERARVLEAKLHAQEAELALAERETEEMGAELRRAAVGAGVPPTAAGEDVASGSASGGAAGGAGADPLDEGGAGLREEIDAMARAGRRARQEVEAEARLAELKKRMGK